MAGRNWRIEMEKQTVQNLIEKLNIELDIQKEKIENDSILNLILNNNIEKVQYLGFLKQELEHLLGYFERHEIQSELESNIKIEAVAIMGYLDCEVNGLSDKSLNEITVKDIAKIKAHNAYLGILNGKTEY